MACKITRFSDPVLMTDTQKEYWNIHNNLRHQAEYVDRMLNHIHAERARLGYDVHWQPVPVLVDRRCTRLANHMHRDWRRVEALEKDLYSWKSSFESVHDRFAELRRTMDRCDHNMDKLRTEVKKYSATVDNIVSKTKQVEHQYNALSDQFNFKKLHWDYDVYKYSFENPPRVVVCDTGAPANVKVKVELY